MTAVVNVVIYLFLIVISTMVLLWLFGQMTLSEPNRSLIKNVILLVAAVLVFLVLISLFGVVPLHPIYPWRS